MGGTAVRTRAPQDAGRLQPVFADSIDAFDGTDWDRLGPGVMVGRGWLRVLEKATVAEERPRYLALRHGERLHSAAMFREIRAGASIASPDRMLLGRLHRPLAAIGLSFTPCLLVGSHKDCDPTLLGRDRGRVLDLLLEHAEDRGLPLVFRRLPASDTTLRGLLRERGFLATADQPVACMEIRWRDFDGYVESLRSRSRKLPGMVRQEIRRCARSGVEIREITDPEPWAARLYGLARTHHERLNPEVPFPWRPGLFPLLERELGERCVILGGFAGRELLGFTVLVHDGRSGHLPFCGFEARARSSLLYFNLAYYRPVRLAIELGLQRLHAGILQRQVKARRGFGFMPTMLCYRAPGRMTNLAAAPLFRAHRWLAEHWKFAGVLAPS